MASYPRFTPTERRKLTMSARARESFRAVGIRGGAGPGEGAPSPLGDPSYYELSEDDRALFEKVIDDNNSSDPVIRQQAATWWARALDPMLQVLNPSLNLLPLISGGSGILDTVLDFWGFKVYQDFQGLQDACGGGSSAAAVTSASLKQGAGDQVHLNNSVAYTPIKWECVPATNPSTGNPGVRFHNDGINVRVRDDPLTNISHITNHGSVTFYVDGNIAEFGGGLLCTPPEDALAASDGGAQVFSDSFTTSLLDPDKCMVVEVGVLTGWACAERVCRGEDLSFPLYEPTGSPSVAPLDTPADIPINPCDMLDGLRDYPYAPPPGSPPGTPPITPSPETPPITPPPGDTPPVQPPDPGTNPFPGQPPVDPTPDGECFIDATTISAAAVSALKSGIAGAWSARTNDNAERLYAPQGSDGCRDFDRIDEAYLIDALVAEGWSNDNGHVCPPASWCASSPPPNVPPGVPIPPVTPPGPVVPGIDPIGDGITDPGEGGCMTLSKEPAAFRDPTQAGGIARQYQPGQPMVIDYGEGSRCKTKIIKVKPNTGEDGGPEICVGGGIDNGGKTTDKTCYGPGPVTDAIQSVLGEMIAEGGSIIFDSDCDRELRRPLCFRAGTSKRVILNKLLDMCGFCMFPQFDCNVIVGYCGPVNVVWTYHEDVDLIKFDLEYDGQEVYDYVEVFRGDWISRAGNVFVRGNSVLYPVGSPASSVSGDRIYQYEVPYSTPDSELASIAITLAAKLRAQALPEIAFGVPLNSMLNQRHQLRIQMPSLGFDAYYMITRLARDYDRENGHLSTGLARWLHAA